MGEYRNVEEWAMEFLEETGGLQSDPDSLRDYIDYAKWARDAELGGDIMELRIDGASHVFWNH